MAGRFPERGLAVSFVVRRCHVMRCAGQQGCFRSLVSPLRSASRAENCIVQRLRVKFSFDRALCDKGMKIGRHVLWTKLIIFRYSATLVVPACCRGNEFNVQVTSSQKIRSTVATIGHSTLQLLPTERAPDSDPESTLLCSFVDIITGLIVRWCSVTKIARLCLFLETSPIFAPASPNLFWE